MKELQSMLTVSIYPSPCTAYLSPGLHLWSGLAVAMCYQLQSMYTCIHYPVFKYETVTCQSSSCRNTDPDTVTLKGA